MVDKIALAALYIPCWGSSLILFLISPHVHAHHHRLRDIDVAHVLNVLCVVQRQVIWLILGMVVFSNDFFSLISVILPSMCILRLVLWAPILASAENFHELPLQLFLLILFLLLRLGHGSVVE